MKCSICDKNKGGRSNNFKDPICKECVSKHMHSYYLRNQEKIKQRSGLWKMKNKNKVIEGSRIYRKRLKINALRAYSNNKVECACCGEKELDFLCLDHIDNDGKEDRKKTGIGTSFLKWLKMNNYPKNLRLQVFCFNCNMSKRIQNGMCVHQLRE